MLSEEYLTDINKAIKLLEKNYNINVSLASSGGSTDIGLNNISDSDFDIYALAKDLRKDEITFKSQNIDIFCFSEDYVIKNMHSWELICHKYPTILYRDLNPNTNEYNDSARSLIMRIMISNLILRDNYLLTNPKEVARGLIIINVLDYFYSRAYSSHKIFIECDNIPVRKYLYTLYNVYAMKWVLQQKSRPLDFFRLFSLYGANSNVCKKVISLYCMNINSNSKDDLVINKDDEINNYIHENLTKLQFDISAYFENKENETLKIY